MVDICFYFQVHQPYRMRKYGVFDIGKKSDYFDIKKNIEVMRKVSEKCYLPTNKLMLDLIKKHPEFKISYSMSGTALEQFSEYAPDVLQSFQKLTDTGNVEILDETYHHSLSFLHSKKEFDEQVKMHRRLIGNLFNQKPTVFRNTELIYNNELAKHVQDLGYKGILSEGADHILDWRSPNFLYTPKTAPNMKLLMKNYKLSDDIAFRFSNKGWKEWPLTVDKYSDWINKINGNGEVVNLFMDYETFGEHQWEDTGIFKFMEKLPDKILKQGNGFVKPTEAIIKYSSKAEIDIHNPISWADLERDLSAWKGNKMQDSSLDHLYKMEQDIMQSNDAKLIADWRKLTTSDHFYYMCTKYFSDGDVHKYFNPYDSPYDSFIAFMNVINDIKLRLKKGPEMVEKKGCMSW